MYTAHFGLKEPPFSITPDPRYLFMSERHREALAHLLYGAAEGGGFVQLTGEVGTGKTTLCRCLLEQLPPKLDVALILNPKLTSLELLAAVCDELRIEFPEGTASTKVLVDALSTYLLDAHARGRRTMLIVDEAQDLSAEVLEQIRLLTNLETAREKLLQIILIGQPELIQLLGREDLRQLAQRITARYHLEPFAAEETRAYIRHRLQIAGRTRGIFTDAAIRRVHRVSAGIPRLINIVCDRALLGAYAQDKTHVDARMVDRAAAEIRGHRGARGWITRLRVAIAAGVVAVAALTAAVLAAKPFRVTDGGRTGVASPVRPPGASLARASAASPAVVTAAPIAAGANSAAPLALAQILADPALRADAVSAFTALYTRWGVDNASTKAQRGCAGARDDGLRCLLRTGSWNRLRRYNLPAILELVGPSRTRHFVAVLSLDGAGATLDVAGRQVTAPVREVETFWDGDFILLWRPPVAAMPLAPGVRTRDVDWLRRRLAAIDSGPATAKARDVYDQELRERVVAFQRSRALDADGVVGEETLVQLMLAAPEPGTPLLSGTRS